MPLASAQDHKRVGDGDTGPNTGGMGAYSPVPAVDAADGERLADVVVAPTLHELRRRGIDYRGVLYAGLMLTPDGPKVLEYNVRFGDPEAQVVLPRLEGDVAALLAEAAAGALRDRAVVPARRRPSPWCAPPRAIPAAPRTGDVIDGLDDARAVAGRDGLSCAGVAPMSRRPPRHGRRAGLAVTALGTDARHEARAPRPTRRVGAHRRGPGMHVATRHRRARSRENRTPDDPALRASRDGGHLLRHRPLRRWLEIELLATEAWARSAWCRRPTPPPAGPRAPVVDDDFVAAVDERERVTDHDVAAFVDVVQQRIGGEPGRWIHYGLTSSDVVDTALCWALRDAADLLIAASSELIARAQARRALATATRSWWAAPTASTPSRRPSG